MITIFKNIRSTSAGFDKDISYILSRIKEGKSKNAISAIRSETDKERRNELKSNLPSICFSGQFSTRSKSGLIEHSGYLCLDFDDCPIEEWRDTLIGWEHSYAVFTSPSGNGLKVIVRIPPEADNHKLHFQAIADYFDTPYLDKSGSDYSRVCYESYDTDLYINEDAKLWDTKAVEDYEEVGSESPTIPIQSSNIIINRLEKWWLSKFGMIKGARNENLFKFAAAMNDFGISEAEARNQLYKYVEDGIPERMIDQLTTSAYRKQINHGSKFFNDTEKVESIKKMVRSGKSLPQIKQAVKGVSSDSVDLAVSNIKDDMMVSDFWGYSQKGAVKLNPHDFKLFLKQRNFAKYFPQGSEAFIFVKIDANLLDETSTTRIKDYVLDYLEHRDDIGIKPYNFMAESTRYFKEDFLSFLDTAQVELKEDTPNTAYLYFRNCALEVTNKKVTAVQYIDLDGYVWKKHIIDRDYIDEVDSKESVFSKFVMKIAGDDQARYDSLRSVAGYLMHSYKSSGNNRAIIFNDETISDNPNGGSGKGLFCNAIGHMKRLSTLDGKKPKLLDSQFAMQTVTADTQVLLFDDVKKNFHFEDLFSLITEGITIEKKNKDAIKLPVAKSPKIVINTNYTIGGVGGSHERRKHEVELSGYFGAHHTPEDEFNHMLFDDWSESEWARFDHFMIGCIQHYLSVGLQGHEFKNLEVRKLIKETSSEFVEWANDRENLPFNEELNKNYIFEDFTSEYSDFSKRLTQRRFSAWAEIYAKHNGLEFSSGRGNGFRWLKLTEVVQDEIEF